MLAHSKHLLRVAEQVCKAGILDGNFRFEDHHGSRLAAIVSPLQATQQVGGGSETSMNQKSSEQSAELERSFSSTMGAAEAAPNNRDTWDHLEELADKLQRPDEVAALYCKLLESGMDSGQFASFAERAVGFHEEWFGDNPPKIIQLLERIVHIDPSSDWAFEQLTVMLTSSSDWEALLALYDNTLDRTSDPIRRKRLLNDAAQVAKDFAEDGDRAANYLRQQLSLDPENEKVATSLERMFERQKRYADLIELWRSRLGQLAPKAARSTKLKIAALLLNEMQHPSGALAMVRALLVDAPGDADACALLETILQLDNIEIDLRMAALDLLRRNYMVAQRHEDIIVVLEKALALFPPEERATLHREAASRLTILDRYHQAMGHYRQLLLLDAQDMDARRHLRRLAAQSDGYELLAEALAAAAEAHEDNVEILAEAAALQRRELGNTEAAIELYRAVLNGADGEADTSRALAAAHALSELLAADEHGAERLKVLEQLANLEQSKAVCSIVCAQAARLAEQLGESDRALSNWQKVLELNALDIEAHLASLRLLESQGRYEELQAALLQQDDKTVLPQQRRADLVRVAQIQANQLEQPAAAIQTWQSIREQFGPAEDCHAALLKLYQSQEMHGELAALLADTIESAEPQVAARLTLLGTTYRGALGDEARALSCYRRALALDPTNSSAREGLHALVDGTEDRAHGRRGSDVLATAYRLSGEREALAEMVALRLGYEDDPLQQLDLLVEAAGIVEATEPAKAVELFLQALRLQPNHLGLEKMLLRLAEQGDHWRAMVDAFVEIAEALEDQPQRAVALFCRAAELNQANDGDVARRLAVLAAAAALAPKDQRLQKEVCVTASMAAQWSVAADGWLRIARAQGRLPESTTAAIEQSVAEQDAWSAWSQAVAEALAETSLASHLGYALEMRALHWFRDRAGDSAGAEQAASRAVAYDPTQPEALGALVDLREDASPAALVESLLKVDALRHHDLDALHRAIQLAQQSGEMPDQVFAMLRRLYRKAGGMWLRGEVATGKAAAAELSDWSLAQLVDISIANDQAQHAIDALLEGTRLPFDEAKLADMKLRAAEMLAEDQAWAQAIELYRSALAVRPTDLELIARLATVCEQHGQVSDALALRSRQLGLVEDREERVALRLEQARLMARLEKSGGLVAAFKQNLREWPGHEASIAALSEILEQRMQIAELVDVLVEQAQLVEATEAGEEAAELWRKAARLVQAHLNEPSRAIDYFGKAVELHSDNDSLDALANLHSEHGKASVAAAFLKERLKNSAEAEQVAVLLRLARTYVRSEDHESAIDVLKRAFEEAPRNAEVRKQLLRSLRRLKSYGDLAATLSRAAEHASDEQLLIRYAREAVELFHGVLQNPSGAVGILRQALEVLPSDKELRAQLANSLCAAGELGEAKALLVELVADFGRRRSPERAAVHLLLARVAHAEGNVDEALDHLDTASRIESGNVTILKTLAEMAREGEQPERAERAYRTLLMAVKRASDVAELAIGPTEVLIELSLLAEGQGANDKSVELMESAMESIVAHDFEAERVLARLAEAEKLEVQKRMLEVRLQGVRKPYKKGQVYASLGALVKDLEGAQASVSYFLEAVRVDPGNPAHHEAAWQATVDAENLDAYVSLVEALLSDERADNNAHVRCELLLRLGEVLEKERQDLERAAELYQQADTTDVRQADVWRAQARVAASRGDEAEQMRLLEKLASIGGDKGETRADALYRIAEVQLAMDETVAEGIESMRLALSEQASVERASMILRRASEMHAEHGELLDLYETVVRRGSNQDNLLHYLEQRAQRDDVTPEQIREAVELSVELQYIDRGEALMLIAAALRERLDEYELPRIAWALVGLASHCRARGDIAGAVKWVGEASEVANKEQLLAEAEATAELAGGPDGDLTLASKLYGQLLEHYPTEEAVWGRLATIYTRLGDMDRLERMVAETLDGLQETEARNTLRLALASALVERQERVEEAVELLQQVLREQPERARARELLRQHYKQAGKTEDLVAMLNEQLSEAAARDDRQGQKEAALELCNYLSEDGEENPVSLLRRTLENVPQDADLLIALLEKLPEDAGAMDRADLYEQLLGIESGEAAADRCLQLLAVYDECENPEAAMGALQLGVQRAPQSKALWDELTGRFREAGDFSGLGQCLLGAAETQQDDAAKIALWCEVAAIENDELDNPGRAVDLLRACVELSKDDLELRMQLIDHLRSAGDLASAVVELAQALDGDLSEEQQVRLLSMRAELHDENNEFDAALADLRAAYRLDADAVAGSLERQLLVCRGATDDAELQRDLTMRCVDVMHEHGKSEEATELLRTWVEENDEDLAALIRLQLVDEANGNWTAVADSAERVVALSEGSERVQAVLLLSNACRELGEPARALPCLETLYQQDRTLAEVRAELKTLYEQAADYAQLAQLLVEEAEEEEGDERRALLLHAGRTFMQVGDAAAALPPLTAAYEQDEDNTEALLTLIDGYTLAGWYDNANELLDKTIEANRGRRTAELSAFHHRKARVAAAMGDSQAQLQSLQEAHSCSKKNGYVAAELADLAEYMQDWDLAVKTLRTITLIDSPCPITRGQAFLRQGKIANYLGDEKGARMWARRAQREEAESPDVVAFLQQLGERV